MVRAYKSKSFFAYEQDDFNLLAEPGAVTNFTWNTHGDSDFFWEKFSVFAAPADPSAIPVTSTRDGQYVPNIRMQLTNQTTGRQLSNVPIALANVDSFLQFNPVPMIWPKKSNLQIQLTCDGVFESGSAVWAIIQMSFLGTKAFH
jgi:hypothetical protein